MDLQKIYFDLVSKFEEFSKALTEENKRMALANKKLSERGWAISLWMSVRQVNEIIELSHLEKFESIDQKLERYYTKELRNIESAIIKRFPHRSAPLKALFHTHNKKMYFASVPLALIQADGICREILGADLYGSENEKGNILVPKTKRPIRKIEGDSNAALLEPLANFGLINANKSHKQLFTGDLNRHDIIHGNNNDYGKKINSLKVISWLWFISNTLTFTKRER